jgi:2-phospho-L-lactate guanylyltransferase (CobY/MobA/RfbA family)
MRLDSAGRAVTAVVPVRPWRLAPIALAIDARDRTRLARAFTLDVLRALRDTPSVSAIVIVTDERDFPPEALGAEVTIAGDRSLMSADPVNHAIRVGARWAVSRHPHQPVVVIPADLPSMTASVLEATLDQMRQAAPRSFVADLSSKGRTLVAVEDASDLIRFGTGSARQGRRGGHRSAARRGHSSRSEPCRQPWCRPADRESCRADGSFGFPCLTSSPDRSRRTL